MIGYLGGALVALEFLTPWRLRRVQSYEDRTFAEALGWYPLIDRKSTRLNSSHMSESRMPSSA